MAVDDPSDTQDSVIAAKPVYKPGAGSLFGILITNALLGFVTLGIYRFWGKTRLRRYIWGRVRFLDEAFEYSGTAMELLIGFLIVVAILIPLVIAHSLVDFLLIDSLSSEEAVVGQMVSQSVALIVFFFLIQVAIFRARRYRLTRTRWRGIAGAQSGSSLKYALLACGLIVLTALSLGLAYPFMSTTLERYKIGNTWLGTEGFSFTGQARALFPRWLLCWLFMVPTLFIVFFWYRARELRYFTAQTRLGGLQFSSDITGGKIFLVYLLYYLALSGLGVVVNIVVVVATATTGGFTGTMEDLSGASVVLPLVIGLSTVLVLLFASVLYTLLVTSRLLEVICDSLEVRGAMDFDALEQSALSAPKRGEGLADALDVGGL